jgi:ElaB/YqjD/DUF883 family membrane-anchored ribosome-binding protein
MNSTTGQIDGGSSDLERNTDAIREDMNRTLDEIERKLSPGQLLDRSLGYLREHGSSIADAVGQTVRRNPLPAFMTAAGLVWMVSATYRSGPDSDATIDGDDSDYPESSNAGYGATAPDQSRSQTASDAGQGIRAKVSSGLDSASNLASSTKESVVGNVRGGASKASGIAKKAMQSTQQQTQRARQGFQQMVDEQPLTVAAMGFAVGALISAALPATEWEKRALGQARERALAKAKEVGEDAYEELRGTLRGASASSDSNQQREDGHAGLNH